MLTLSRFSSEKPRYRAEQSQALEWLTRAHAASQATSEGLSDEQRDEFAARLSKLVQRCACGPDKIATRYHAHPDLVRFDFSELSLYDVTRQPHGAGTDARSRAFADIVNAYFEREYESESVAPSDLIHVTCTGYVSPSGAQRLVASKGWGAQTRITHAYHMGCYAAFPAIRIAAGQLSLQAAMQPDAPARRADVVHTELCTLHLDPSQHSAEQCVVQSLFADGFMRYSVTQGESEAGLELLSLSERVLPDSAAAMAWSVGDFGMQMSLSRDVPERIAAQLRPFVADLVQQAGLELGPTLKQAAFAVHPGGPKIIDRVGEVLELDSAQLQVSREVLRDHGNMSSATLPHVWMRLLAAPEVQSGTLIISLAFGPGLTVCGGVFRKR